MDPSQIDSHLQVSDGVSPEVPGLDFCRQLNCALKALALYGADHPATGPALEELYRVYQHLTTDGRKSKVAFSPEQLIIDGTVAEDPDALLESLCRHMHGVGIARLEITPGAPMEELSKMVTLVAKGSPEIRVDLRDRSDERADELFHFRLHALDYRRAVERLRESAGSHSTSIDERAREIWYALVTGTGGGSGEILTREAMEFVQELIGQEGCFAELKLPGEIPDGAGGGEIGQDDTVSGRLLARLINHLQSGIDKLPEDRRPALLRDLAARSVELPAEKLAELLAAPEVREGVLPESLATLSQEQVLDAMAAVVRVEGVDSPRLSYCISAFMRKEERREQLLPSIHHRLHRSTEEGDGETLAIWKRVDELAIKEGGRRYMSSAYDRQLNSFADEEWPELVEYPAMETVSKALLETLEPEFLARAHTHLLLDLVASEQDLAVFEEVVDILFEQLLEAIDGFDFELATLIASDLKNQSRRGSPRPREFKQVIWQRLGELPLAEIADQAFEQAKAFKSDYFGAFQDFLSVFQGAIANHLLDRLEEEEDRAVRKSILNILSSFTEELIPELLRRIDHTRWFYVRNVVHLLGRSGSEEAVRPLTMQLKHPDPRVQREVLVALRSLDAVRSVPFVVRILVDESGQATPEHDQVRIEAARFLSRFQEEEAAQNALRKGVLSKRAAVAAACRNLLHHYRS